MSIASAIDTITLALSSALLQQRLLEGDAATGNNDNGDSESGTAFAAIAQRLLAMTEGTASARPIPAWRLVLSAAGPLVLLLISQRMRLGMEKKILVGLVRSSAQLLFLGFVLLGFIFSFRSPLVVFVYLLLMILIAALEATGRQVRTYEGHYETSLIACAVGGGVTGLYASLVVFHPSPWWSAKVVIPTAGMIIGNSVSGPAVATERLLSEVMDKTHETETRLAFGASAYESILPMVRAAIQAALLPTFNQMAIMGLVSIPGMMTGQLLGGTAPFTAAEYQIAILYLIVTTSAISTFLSVILTIRRAVFDTEHRLTKHKLFKRQEGKMEIDTALYQLLKTSAVSFVSAAQRVFSPSPSSTGAAPVDEYNALPSSDFASTHGGVELVSNPLSSSANRSSSLMREQRGVDIEREGEDLVFYDVSDPHNLLDGRVFYSLVDVETEAASEGVALSLQREFPCLPSHNLLLVANLNVKSGDATKLFHERGLDFSLRVGERVTLEGPSGIGKTRLLRAISQLDAPLQGFASFDRHFVQAPPTGRSGCVAKQWFIDSFKSQWTVPDWRCRLIYVPQALPPMAGSPKDLLKECLEFGVRSKSPAAKTLLKDLDTELKRMEQSLLLRDGILTSEWKSLSGGERQRAAIAAGILLGLAVDEKVEGPSGSLYPQAVLLLDEPTAACDATSCEAVERTLLSSRLAMVIITHDERQSRRIAHRRILLKQL